MKKINIEVRPISKENESALALPNEPFPEGGRVVPSFDGENWNYRFEELPPEEINENCFPDENYKFDEMGDKFHGLAAYVDGVCAGYALFYEQWNKWLYLDNLLVLKKYRRTGVASALIEEGMRLSKDLKKLGVWLVCQDNNLGAMKFYLKAGFSLGGMNLPVYEGTRQAGKADLYLYRRNEE